MPRCHKPFVPSEPSLFVGFDFLDHTFFLQQVIVFFLQDMGGRKMKAVRSKLLHSQKVFDPSQHWMQYRCRGIVAQPLKKL
jgi:hypothetical protein